MRLLRPRLTAALLAAVALLATHMAASPAAARASSTLTAIFEDDLNLRLDPTGTLMTFRMLGANAIKLGVVWSQVAPNPLSHRRPRRFNAADPAAYPAANWASFDAIIRDATADGIRVDVDLDGGAPLWATGPGAPAGQHPNWEPKANEYEAFARAIGTRYSGHYVPSGSSVALPRVSFWSVWDEPNLGYTTAPQTVPGHRGVENSGRMYRGLLDGAWNGLRRTGHGHDLLLIGELAPRGVSRVGVFNAMKPLQFLRALYCVDSHYRPLRGSAASLRGCPASAAGSRQFKAAHPVLFHASAYSFHGWMRWYAPNHEAQPDPDYASFAELGGLERALDRLQRAYGSRRKFPLYNTEFGYITNPPNHTDPYVSPMTAAYYLNWAEYISYKNPRIASFDNYLLRDPAPYGSPYTGWASGLVNYSGSQKATYDAWRLPLYLPSTVARAGHALEVWGCARPAPFAHTDTAQPQTVAIQFQPASGGPFRTLATVSVTNRRGYFDTRVLFPSNGTVRLSWSYPAGDPLLENLPTPTTINSRGVAITVG